MLGNPQGKMIDRRLTPRPATTARTVARWQLAMARASFSLVLALAFVVLAQAAAGAREAAPSAKQPTISAQSWEGEGCGPFSLTQTYTNWGPARHYGQAVTVVYDATGCSRHRGDTVHLTVQGAAVVYEGTGADGPSLDRRPFYVSGRWVGASNPQGWPPDWWECDVRAAEYTWRIAGVYSFAVAARDGRWSLDVAESGRNVHWAYDAC